MIIYLVISFLQLLPSNTLTPVENLCGIMYPYSGENDWGDGAILFQPDSKFILYSDTIDTVFGFLRIFENGWDIRDKYLSQQRGPCL